MTRLATWPGCSMLQLQAPPTPPPSRLPHLHWPITTVSPSLQRNAGERWAEMFVCRFSYLPTGSTTHTTRWCLTPHSSITYRCQLLAPGSWYYSEAQQALPCLLYTEPARMCSKTHVPAPMASALQLCTVSQYCKLPLRWICRLPHVMSCHACWHRMACKHERPCLVHMLPPRSSSCMPAVSHSIHQPQALRVLRLPFITAATAAVTAAEAATAAAGST